MNPHRISRPVLCVLGILLLLATALQALAASPPAAKPLEIRSIADTYQAAGSNGGQAAAAAPARPLRVGVGRNDEPPFFLNRGGNQYEGIVADYLHLIGRSAGRKVEVYAYDNKTLARDALRAGAVDLIADSARPGAGLIASAPFFSNRQIEVRAISQGAVQPSKESIAVSNWRASDPELRAAYPKSKITAYRTIVQALEAVAYGDDEVYIGNATSANFIIDQLQLLGLAITNFAKVAAPPFVFIARESDRALIAEIDRALAAIPVRTSGEIQQRWLGAASHFRGQPHIAFTDAERAWIAAHPTVTYAALRDLAPFHFLDKNRAELTGLTVDILALVSSHTGIRFVPEIEESSAASFGRFAAGTVDILPSVFVVEARRERLLFTRPFAQSLEGLIVLRSNEDIRGPADLGGKRLGVLAGSRDHLTLHPAPTAGEAKIVEAPNVLTLFELLLSGRIDAISLNVITANFLIGQRYERDVKIVATSNEQPMQIAFGVQKSAPLLVDIIDKVLVTTPPEVLDAMRRDAMRYRPARLMSGLSDLETQSVLRTLYILLALLATGGGYLAWSVNRRKRQAAALRTELARQDVLVNAVPFALFLRSRDGRLVSCNQLFANAFGLPRAAMLSLSEFPGASDGDANLGAELATLCHTLGQDGQPHFIDRRVRIGTDERDLYMWVIPVRNQGPLAGALLGGWLDITARKCAERQLEVARMEAETANRAKTTFLATISHEIRTPMNAILGLLELELSEGRTPGKASLKTVRHTAESLLDLIDELLDYSKIEAGQLTVSPQPADVGTELRRLAQMYRPLTREKGLAFQCRIDSAIPPVLMADPLRLRQVVGNLLGNALKFTDHGTVTLDAAWSAAAGRLQVRVEDTGCGIRQEDQARIFEPFEQATEGSAPRQKGTGLGLWICHSLIAQMGGSLLLASVHGKGSTFVATIPLEAAQEVPRAAPVPPDTAAQDISAALRVLVVDDHPANLELLPQQLRFLGISQVQTAENGMQALARLEASPFDIVLTDCSMPVMDGYALAAAIRDRPQWAGLVVVGFTADARHEAAERAVAAGMTACLTKPVGLDKLRWVLAAYGGQGAAASAHQPSGGKVDDIHAALASLCGDNPQARTALLSTLVATNEEDRQAVHDLLASGDYEAAAAHAHRIKGTGLFIGATSLVEVCQAMEAALRAHDPDRSREWLSRLLDEIERLHRQCEDILNGSSGV